MNGRALRRRLRALLRDLDLHPPLAAEELCRRLGEQRRRPIVLVPTDLPGAGAFGALVPMRTKDLIIYQTRLVGMHREAVIFHEFSHLFLHHITTALAAGKTLVCNLDLADADLLGDATLYDQIEEWEAETGAAILCEWARIGSTQLCGAPSAEEQAICRGLGRSDWI